LTIIETIYFISLADPVLLSEFLINDRKSTVDFLMLIVDHLFSAELGV